ncbi:MAG TPA: flagellar motor protein MotB, partial [Clostridiaceae bacterium]|nr:flagellar motor protein MotB [Clostridiaceae bacterium]
RIEGHTDNRPINNEQFDSNWELSTSRAVNVLRRLLDISKIKPDKFSAVGYGEFHPIADNNTASGRAQNRRVDFIIETAANE